jgi:hypothetical protein
MIEADHFKIEQLSDFPEGLKRALLVWSADEDGSMRSIEKLNLKQLNVEIVKVVAIEPGHGWFYFRGDLKKTYYSKD